MANRQIVLDTETTGIEVAEGHRIIEIGCVEVIERQLTGRHYHVYIQPDRLVDPDAMAVHGITDEFLRDKPRFADIADEFMAFVDGGELIIHNAAFDVGFLDAELARLKPVRKMADHCGVLDTLLMARSKHPGQKNTLDALCKRYGVDNSSRELHGALLDAEILADVFLLMTGGQTALSLDEGAGEGGDGYAIRRIESDRPSLRVIGASGGEQDSHSAFLEKMAKSGVEPLWAALES